MKDLLGKIRRNLKRIKNIAKAQKYGYLGALARIIGLMRSRGFGLTEIHDNEIDLGDKEYVDGFLNWREQQEYLKLLNPRYYSRIARNKYLTHITLEAAGIKNKSELYLYYNPALGYLNKEKTSNDLASSIRVLRQRNVRECVIKTTESSHGDNVYVIKNMTFESNDVIMKRFDGKIIRLSEILDNEPLIFESLIKQTEQMSAFNPSSVNTVRFMTTLMPGGDARIIATFIKIGRAGACVDNAGGGGNVDAAVDENTGRLYNTICFNGWRNITSIEKHPDTKSQIEGVTINNWQSIKNKVLEFQKAMPFVKAAGWDIAITDNGPMIVELNDMWDRTGQLFRRKGWKKEILCCYDAWVNNQKLKSE